MELISIYRTAKERILDDKQIFSNIDEANQPLGIFTLGYTQVIGNLSLFFGLRNVNRGYFTNVYMPIMDEKWECWLNTLSPHLVQIYVVNIMASDYFLTDGRQAQKKTN